MVGWVSPKVACWLGLIVVIEAGSSLARPIGRAIVVAERGHNIVGLSYIVTSVGNKCNASS